jgi:hypothetical protein
MSEKINIKEISFYKIKTWTKIKIILSSLFITLSGICVFCKLII